jgi:NADH-quinone oxidoreductase subunit H
MTFDFSFWITLLFIVIVVGVMQGVGGYLTLLERKVAAWTQDRLGPNRVGPLGLFQPIADGVKFLLKEQVIPSHVDKVFYLLAPAVAIGTALLAFAVVPFGPTMKPPSRPWPQTRAKAEQYRVAHPEFDDEVRRYNETTQFVIAPHVDVGIVYVFAVGSLAVYGIVLGGWSSNNKYSFMGSLRSSAQLISYEIPMGMAALGVLLMSGSLNLETIIDYQARNGWHVLYQPLACLLFITSVFAECNRLPFDLPEAEQELVGGYHTEYSAMKFALFFLGEYTHMITTSFLVVILFFGGWQILPWVSLPEGVLGDVLKVAILAGKVSLFILFYMFVRWTIPRFRFDQLMGLAWKVLMPLALVNLVCVLVVRHFGLGHWDWVLLPASLVILVAGAGLAVCLPRGPARAHVPYRGHGTAQSIGMAEDVPALR